MRRVCLGACVVFSLAGSAFGARPEVVIDSGGAPPEVLQSITKAVEAITRLAEDQDVREVSRLRRRAREAAHSALQTQGYFSPVVTLDVSENATGEIWAITIKPGVQSQVRTADLSFTGSIAQPRYADRRQTLKAGWLLTPGKPFINAHWAEAKRDLLDQASRKDFYFARLGQTRATIHPDTAQADLTVPLDSGPQVTMGEMRVLGLKRVPASLIERYVRYAPGDPYDQDKLDAWQEALQATTFFRGAFVTLAEDADASVDRSANAVQLPVQVQLTEAPARYASASLGADSDHGVRIEGLYRQNIVWGQPVWIETGAGLDQKRQRAFFDVYLPPSEDGYKNSFGVLYDHSDIEGVETSRTGLGWKRSQTRQAAGDSRVEYEVQWGMLVAYDKTRVTGAYRYEVPTWAGTWQWLRRDVDAKYEPREGNLIDFGLGVGTTLDDGQPFYRSSLRAQQWWPIGARDVLTLRGEVGKVWSDTDRLPQDFSFRTGGSRSIRGYRYQSIGIERGEATIGAPALALASLQYTHYFTELLGASVFVDVGDAAPSFKDMDWHLGYGLGVAFRTPAGPFNIDLAWGEKDRRLRLHFSLGIAF
ncbi:BamA/TamA family outer membrane protein [Alcaligenaceae bacterium CGII-47]|nr:BamA/TamA family outer membrane protein [Alcaligenaceae bacterium CGII-47]